VKIQTARGTSLAVSVHLGTSLRYVDQVPKCPKVVHLGLDHVSPALPEPVKCSCQTTGLRVGLWKQKLDHSIPHNFDGFHSFVDEPSLKMTSCINAFTLTRSRQTVTAMRIPER
jgi:hypothetical protein